MAANLCAFFLIKLAAVVSVYSIYLISQDMPLDAEEIKARFSPDEEYTNNNQSEGQLLEVTSFQKNRQAFLGPE